MMPFVEAIFPEEEILKTAQNVADAMLSNEKWKCDIFDSEPTVEEVQEYAVAFVREQSSGIVLVNDVYQVVVREAEAGDGWPRMLCLSIKRLDREPIHDWRHLQEIKNEVIGPENEAVELYPAESRLMDTANQYWLWVLANPAHRFPFGFTERIVSNGTLGKSKQRPI